MYRTVLPADHSVVFTGVQNSVVFTGLKPGMMLSCVSDIAAAFQHTVASHLAKRTHRAIAFCEAKALLPRSNPTLVVIFVVFV